MARLEMDDLCAAFAAPVPSPAGGSAAAAVAAIAASMVMMVGRGSPDWAEGAEAEASAAALREQLLVLGGEDVEAVEALLAAFRLRAQPGVDGGADVVGAVLRAAGVPLEIARCASAVAGLARDAAEHGKRPMRADAEAAATLAASATLVAASIVDVNLRGFSSGPAQEESAALLEAARIVSATVSSGSSGSEVRRT